MFVALCVCVAYLLSNHTLRFLQPLTDCWKTYAFTIFYKKDDHHDGVDDEHDLAPEDLTRTYDDHHSAGGEKHSRFKYMQGAINFTSIGVGAVAASSSFSLNDYARKE